ncbi:MAG: 23S rRNA (adenine(2503)-C(2))-methyltransferase RlmN [Treponema sp.]|jgi:23S rRNA (adenine2503-C2)-methyltransferase|nr:23S rRNA (adenine(2503)-C(2))-methyltransferase RlmN [Treponema sp.]
MPDSEINSIPVLSGMPLEELAEYISPLPHFRAVQICKWIASGASSFDAMDNLPLPLRKELGERFTLRPDAAVQKHSGDDGTVKLTLQFADGARIEAVLLSDSSGRRTACLSTQAGCPAGCVFCKTGAAFLRNLTSAEITEQFLQLKALADEDAASVSNIVVMGMGEPLLNLTELRRALAVITGTKGLNFSRRRITVSTCGIARGINELADKGPAVRLALSLTTADESLRRRLMPITAQEPLAAVKKALRHFQDSGGGRITLEAVLLGGINTRREDAAGMAQFARGLDAAVNLIPWNPVKGLEFEGKALRQPAAAEIESFTQQLKALGLNVTRRYRRGRGVMGACGQLGSL